MIAFVVSSGLLCVPTRQLHGSASKMHMLSNLSAVTLYNTVFDECWRGVLDYWGW
jgi:hypothetical protein